MHQTKEVTINPYLVLIGMQKYDVFTGQPENTGNWHCVNIQKMEETSLSCMLRLFLPHICYVTRCTEWNFYSNKTAVA